MKLNQQKFKKSLDFFKDFSRDARFKEDVKERLKRKEFFKRLANSKFSELNFSEMIKELWASKIWGNKDYLVSKIIKDNGIDKLEKELSHLLSRNDTLGERYERFLKNIKGMGPSMVTEILCSVDPNNAGIWNNMARNALAWLEVENISYEKYKISGHEYKDFNKSLKELAEILNKEGYNNVDLLFVDYFLWEIWEKVATHEEVKLPTRRPGDRALSRHDELRDKIAEIGSWLGFEVDTEKQVAAGSRVDVIWKSRVGNLGVVSYVFEVQDRGSIDSLIVNLQQAQIDRTVQKLIIISDPEQVLKIQDRIKTMPEHFRRATTFWEDAEVETTHKSLEQATASISKLNLVEG